MPKYTLKASDGASYTLDSPNELTQDQLNTAFSEALQQSQPTQQQAPQQQQPSYDDQGRGYAAARNFLNEATFGFGKNAVAGLRSLGSGDYQKELAYQKKQLSGDFEQYPATSVISGIGGAVGTSLAATPARVANWVGKGGSFLSRAGRMAAVGAPSGALYGVGNRQEGETIPEAAVRGGVTGAAFAPVGVAAGDLVSGGVRAVRGSVQGVKNLRSGTKQISPKQQIIKEAESRNIPIRTSDLIPPTTRAGRTAELAARAVPFVGTGGQVAKQQESRLSAVSEELVKYNPDLGQNPETLKLLSDEITSSVKGAIKKLREDKVGILNNALYNTGETVPLTKTNEKIDELINKWGPNAGAGSEEATKLVSQLMDLKTRFNANTGTKFLENERELLSTQYADNPTVKSLANQIYGPLNEDMGSFIKGKNFADYSKWKFSNKKISSMIDENQYSALGKIIDKSEVTPEIVKTSIFSNKPSDLNRLNKNLSDEGRKKVQSVIIGDIADKASFTNPNGTKGFSPERFISEIEKKGNQIDVFFDPKDKASLQGLSRVLNATRGAGQAALNPLTGAQLTGVTSLGVLGSLTNSTLQGATLAAGIGLAGRGYESKMVRDLLVTLSKIKKNSPEEKLLINKIISMQASQLGAKENIKERK